MRVNKNPEKPGPRTEDGPAVGTPGSLFPSATGKGKGVTVVELPERDANVLVERAPGALGSPAYIGSGDLYGNVSDPLSGYWTESLSVTDATASWANLPSETRNQIDKIAKLKWPTATGEGLWEKAVKGSNASTKRGNPMSTFEWINAYAENLTGKNAGLGGSGGSGGPRTTTSVSLLSPEDVETSLQEAARDMIGRVLTDEELAKYTKKYQRQQAAAVTTTTRTPTGSVTQQGTSKEEILRRIMQQNPDFAAYQIDTNFMDMFVDSIREGQAVINAGR